MNRTDDAPDAYDRRTQAYFDAADDARAAQLISRIYVTAAIFSVITGGLALAVYVLRC